MIDDDVAAGRYNGLGTEVADPREPRTWRTQAALLLVFAIAYLPALTRAAVLDDADGTHAEAARVMAETNDFVTLKVNGIRYLEKAPLPYWLVAGAFKIFGKNEAALRLPNILAVLGCAALAWLWGGRAFGRRAGTYAALFTLTSLGQYLFTRIFIPEVLLSLLSAAALYCWLTALESGGVSRARWWWHAGYGLLGLAVLTKGLVALVLVGASGLLFLLITGDWRRWREFCIPTGLLLLVVIAAPWHLLAGLRNQGGAEGRGFFWFYFVNEHYLRFLGKRLPKDYNQLPVAAYWLLHLVWLFPWSLYLPTFIRDAKQAEKTQLTFTTKTTVLCSVYAAVVLLFFSFSTNQEYYTFPAYLPLLLLLAGSLARAEEDSRGRAWLYAAHAGHVLLGIAIAAFLAWGLWESRHLPFVDDISSVLARRGIGGYTLSMSHFFDLTPEALAALRTPAILAAAVMIVGPLLALVVRFKGRHYEATWAVALTTATLLLAAQIALARFTPYLSSKEIAEFLQPQLRPSDKVMVFGDQSHGSSLLFYLRRPIYLVEGATTSMHFGSTFPDAPQIFLTKDALRHAWSASGQIFLVVPLPAEEQVRQVIGEDLHVTIRRGGKVVFTNRLH
jgi:4-amino-4-deoxy-L-arabinose transferase-like glycosyltransferase